MKYMVVFIFNQLKTKISLRLKLEKIICKRCMLAIVQQEKNIQLKMGMKERCILVHIFSVSHPCS